MYQTRIISKYLNPDGDKIGLISEINESTQFQIRMDLSMIDPTIRRIRDAKISDVTYPFTVARTARQSNGVYDLAMSIFPDRESLIHALENPGEHEIQILNDEEESVNIQNNDGILQVVGKKKNLIYQFKISENDFNQIQDSIHLIVENFPTDAFQSLSIQTLIKK